MIIRETPKNAEEYIIVDSATSNILHQNGFCPKYINNKNIVIDQKIDRTFIKIRLTKKVKLITPLLNKILSLVSALNDLHTISIPLLFNLSANFLNEEIIPSIFLK